jgi:hypothetical protein
MRRLPENSETRYCNSLQTAEKAYIAGLGSKLPARNQPRRVAMYLVRRFVSHATVLLVVLALTGISASADITGQYS